MAQALVLVRRAAIAVGVIAHALVGGKTLAQPVNDDCASATVVTSPGTYTSTTAGASGFSASPCGAPSDFFDVWYMFTSPVTGAYRFDMQLSPGYVSATLALYDTCDGAALICDDGPDSGPTAGKPEINYQVEAGRTILIRVAMCCGDQWPFTLRVGPGVLPVIPPNDECSAAATLTLNTPLQGTNVNAAGGLISAPCVYGFNDTKDVWYAFTALAAGWYEFRSHGLTSTSFNPFYTTLALYGSCGGGQLACGDDYDVSKGSRIVRMLGAGQSVRLRVAGWASGEGTFELEARAVAAPTPPANDFCEQAIEIAGPGSVGTARVAYATDDAPVSCGLFGAARKGVWYTHVPPRDTNVFLINDSVLPVTMTAYTGADCETIQEIACFRSIPGGGYSGPDGVDMVAGQRYWILMALEADREVSADAAVQLRVLDRRIDSCDRASVLAFPASVKGSNFVFRDEGARASCYALGDIDAWYEFTAPANAAGPATYRFDLLDRIERAYDEFYWTEMSAPVLSLLDGCNGSELACGTTGLDNAIVSLTHVLNPGERVLVRVASNFALTGTYSLEVWSNATALSPNDNCDQAIDFAPGVGLKPFAVAGATTSASQNFTNSFAYAAAGLAPVTLSGDVWYRWVSPTMGLLSVRTNISGFRIAVYNGPTCPPVPASLLNATVDDREMSMPVSAGQTLLFQIGAVGAGETAVANLALEVVPYQGACCSTGLCTVMTSTDCAAAGAGAVFRGPNTACGPVSAQAHTFADPAPVVIPQGSAAATRTINVAEAFTVGAVAAEATLNHPELSDVELVLSHAGRSVTLMRNSGIPNELTGAYTFTDASIYPKGVSWFIGPTRDAAPGGYYRPSDRGENKLLNDETTGFGGVSSAGDWTLSVRDVLAPYRGVLNGWKLTLLARDDAGPCGPAPAGACCRGSTCVAVASSACAGPNTRFAGSGTVCNASGNWRSPCCIADFDQSAGGTGPATLQDLFAFLQAWFADDPAANADRIGTTPDVNDIFVFLQAWFAGC